MKYSPQAPGPQKVAMFRALTRWSLVRRNEPWRWPWVFISRALFLSLLWFLTGDTVWSAPTPCCCGTAFPATPFPSNCKPYWATLPVVASSQVFEDSVRKGSSIVYLLDPGVSRPLTRLHTFQIQVLRLKPAVAAHFVCRQLSSLHT